MILKTQRLTLRPLAADDAPGLFAILGDAAAMAFWERPPLARRELAAEIVASQLSAMADGDYLFWTVLRDGAVIGSVDLSAIEFSQRRADTGFLFRRDQWGQGFGREAMAAMIGHAFGPMGLERLSARIHAGNHRAARLLGALGFCREGLLSGHMLKAGARQDVALFGLLRHPG